MLIESPGVIGIGPGDKFVSRSLQNDPAPVSCRICRSRDSSQFNSNVIDLNSGRINSCRGTLNIEVTSNS